MKNYTKEQFIEFLNEGLANGSVHVFADSQELIDVIKKYDFGSLLAFANDELKDNKEVVLTAMQHSWYYEEEKIPLYEIASERLQKDKEVLIAALYADHWLYYLGHVDQELIKDPEVFDVVKRTQHCVSHL